MFMFISILFDEQQIIEVIGPICRLKYIWQEEMYLPSNGNHCVRVCVCVVGGDDDVCMHVWAMLWYV